VLGLQRSKRVVQETVQVGTETAARLHAQTEQMHRVVEDLDHIHFSMRKAGRLVSDLTRQMATDRCIMFFLGDSLNSACATWLRATIGRSVRWALTGPTYARVGQGWWRLARLPSSS